MKATILTVAAIGAIAVMYGSGPAQAGPIPNTAGDGLVHQVHRGGGGGHGGGGHGARSGGHGGGGHAIRGGGHRGGHALRRHGGGSYYSGYGSYYSDSCWYSRRHHTWVCPYTYY